MLHSETQNISAKGTLANQELRRSKSRKFSSSTTQKSVSLTFSTVEIDGSDLCRDHKDISVARVSEAMRLARLHGKDELMIANIAPGTQPGHSSAARVPLIKSKIQNLLAMACEGTVHNTPECRLDLQGGLFSLRCYLGRTKPTDFIYAEDHLSDSR